MPQGHQGGFGAPAQTLANAARRCQQQDGQQLRCAPHLLPLSLDARPGWEELLTRGSSFLGGIPGGGGGAGTHHPTSVHPLSSTAFRIGVTCSSLRPACPREPSRQKALAPRLAAACGPERKGVLVGEARGGGRAWAWVRHTRCKAWLRPACVRSLLGERVDSFSAFACL